MTIFNNKDFISFSGEPITGRVPPRTTVYGPPMNSMQYAGTAHAYKLFCDAYRLSAGGGGYHVQNQVLADGKTKIRMTSNNGVDTVKVYTGDGRGYLPFPLGIVVSLFKVDEVASAGYYPFWENGARIDITKSGEAETLKEFDVIVQIDPDATLSENSFKSGDVSFKMIPKGVVYGASGMYTIDKGTEKVWPKSVTPWYANGFVSIGPYRFDFPNIKTAIDETDPLLKIERFWTVGFPVTTTEFDPKTARGWLFFLVCIDEVTYKVFARKVIGELDPIRTPSSKDAELECTEIATRILEDDIARFRYDMHLAWSNGDFTLAPVGEMYAGEAFSTISITGDKDSAAATLSLASRYVPTNPSIPAATYSLETSGSATSGQFNNVLYGGALWTWWNPVRSYSFSRTISRLIPGSQDPWTKEWVQMPLVSTHTYTENDSLTYSGERAADGTATSSCTYTASGGFAWNNFSLAASVTSSTVGLFPSETDRVPLNNYSDEKLIVLNEDMSLGRIAGLIAKNNWSVVFTDDVSAANTGLTTSLVVKMRDPLDDTPIPDVVIREDTFCSEFPTALNFSSGYSGITTGTSITSPVCLEDYMAHAISYMSGTTMTFPTAPMIIASGGELPTDPLPPVGTFYEDATYDIAPGPETEPQTYYTRAEFLAAFGLDDGVFETYHTPAVAATITHVRFNVGVPPAANSSDALDKDWISGFTPFFENYEGHLYADPRTMSFIAAFAGAGRTDGIGDVLSAGAPLLRSYAGNKQGATPLEPLINAWIEKTNEGRAAASPPLPPFPTYQLGELFIAWDGALPTSSSPLI